MSADDFKTANDFYADAGDAAGVAQETSSNASSGIVFLDHDDLFTDDPANDNLVIPELGIGSGPPIALIGQGYVGKTLMAMAVGMAVALGRPAWGRYEVRQGEWVHFDYEQGRKETKKRIQRLAAGFAASKDDLRGRMRVSVYPSVNLTTTDARKHYIEVMQGASIATFDALKGITPGVEENSSSMRDYMRILSEASEATGCAVLLIHHAGKSDPSKTRKEMGRGSSAIFDECQSVFVVTGDKESDKRVTHEKDRELGHTVPEFGVRFEDVPVGDNISLDDHGTGALRVLVTRGVDHQHRDRIVAFLGASAGVFDGSKTDLVEAVGMNRSEFYKALSELERQKRVRVEAKSQKKNRPVGRISLISDGNEDLFRRPEPSREDRDENRSSPRNRPAPRPFKDGRDDGTISGPDISSVLEAV